MPPPVHIPIYHKGHISALIHIQDLNLVHVIQGSGITVISIIKSKKMCKLSIHHIIAVQSVACHKCKHAAAITFHQ